MRTTLELDDAVLAAARALATQDGISLGTAVSRLASQGLLAGARIRPVRGFPTFEVAPGAAPITVETVNAHRDG